MTLLDGRRRRHRLGAALTVLTLLCVAACDAAESDEATDAPVTIRFASYNYGTPDLGGQGVQELIDLFEKEHPNITIKPEGGTSKELYTRVQAQAAAGDPPDIAQIGWSKLASAADNLPIVPIDDLASADEVKTVTSQLLPGAIEAGNVDDKLVAMPFAMSTPTLFVNAKLFRAAGLDPAKPPQTWEEVKAAALTIRSKTQQQGVYLSAANAAKSDFLTQSLINSNGGALLSESGDVQLDSPQAVGALSMLGDLTASGAQPAIADDDAISLFKAGKLGMYVTSTALMASFTKAADGSFELRTAGLPRFGDQPARPTYSGAGLVVLSKDKAEQAAAWEFLTFLTSRIAFGIITEKIGYLPLRTDSAADPALAKRLAQQPSIQPAMTQLADVTPYQSMPGRRSDQARQILQDSAVAPIMLDRADPPSTLAKVDQRITELLAS
ncbi:ABC transporter substrate-binding protein [Cryptosporangium aurantiacum]|uniref:Carbohydrate ABC transporter substrate-binding protein, CUT1 family n=1 Tax=Cryptosporangium aurantiacum TaxID=134849 RepID=A0A1M7RMH4_9ACTN|nr:ABC transporter substrate-binding protein [Cryptosporangium aurantiacum]SHN47296.1 carbohydrate ABC transporter substrate-binding protein, CUT1 family [Cryptosporangium aurantiacum]